MLTKCEINMIILVYTDHANYGILALVYTIRITKANFNTSLNSNDGLEVFSSDNSRIQWQNHWTKLGL